jgi:cytochrome c oxidase cbb3-type subunit 2
VERNWGARDGVIQSVDQDYLFDNPVMLGSQRVGPDLANVGLRQGTDTNGIALLKRLYDPQSVMPGSVMPPYRFLFTKRKSKAGEQPSAEALNLGAKAIPGYEVIPTDNALALVAYLQSLRSDGVLYETPPFKKATNAVPAAVTVTNAAASAATTNSPAK